MLLNYFFYILQTQLTLVNGKQIINGKNDQTVIGHIHISKTMMSRYNVFECQKEDWGTTNSILGFFTTAISC